MQSPRGSLSSATIETSPDGRKRGLIDTHYETAHHNRPGRAVQMPPDSAQHSTDASFVGTTTSTIEDLSLMSHLSQYFLVELDPRRADVILIVCGFVGGLVDGLSFNAWGNFSSMQTGMMIASLLVAFSK